MTDQTLHSPAQQTSAFYGEYRKTKHFGSLDGLRFLCIFAVLWHHFPIRRDWVGMPDILSRGHVGVDFFFVLSGFLITTLLLRERETNGHIDLRGFYRRRIVRILPVYYFVILVAAFWSIGIKGQSQYLGILPHYFLFLSNFLQDEIPLLGPTWSLAMEEQYYMIWPALLILLPVRWIVPALLIGITLNVIGVMGLLRPIGIVPMVTDTMIFQLKGPTYAPILMGTLVAVLLHTQKSFAFFASWLSFQGAPWVLFLLLGFVLGFGPGRLEGLPNVMVHSLMCLIVISLVIREDNAMAPFLRLRPIARIGQISYGIYLYHLMTLVLTNEVLELLGLQTSLASFPGFMFYCALTILVAEISFRTLETWFLRFRHKPNRH